MSNTIKGKVLSPLAIDRTLTKENMCADAKATGDAIKEVKSLLEGNYRIVSGEKEWMNPPMEINTEYRTIEKHNSKPVYVKLVDCGGMPSASATKNQAHGISNMEYIVDFGGVMTQNGAGAISLPFYFSNENQARLSVTNENIVIVSGSNNLTSYNDVLVWVKYTKSTD